MAVSRRSRYEETDRGRCSRPWSWLLVGILIGIIFSVFIYMRLILPHTVPTTATATVNAAPVVLAETETTPPDPNKTVVDADKPSTKPETPPTAKTTPRFEFYTVLPDQAVNVNNTPPRPLPLGTNPELETEELATLSVGTAPITTPGTYLLQVGSFRDLREAEGLRTHLASLGITAHIERATLSNSNDVWHRVRLGPFNDLNRLNQTRARLTQHNITAIVVQF
jgi:cell division protein FtsN